MSFASLGVVGAGQMGAGIAEVAAFRGIKVVLLDASTASIDRALAGIQSRLRKQIEKGKCTEEELARTIENIRCATDLAALSEVECVIEAITENREAKAELFRSLDGILNRAAVLATNTSSLSITELGGRTRRPDRVIGIHFMNPVPVMKLIEVIRGLQTSEETYERTLAFGAKLQKSVVTSTDAPGFIVNRILMPMINEAVFALETSVARKEDIDQAMKLGTNHPMGPLELADFIGLDTCLAIMEVLHRELGDSKYRPCPLLRKYVEAGWLGRKTKRGFYSY